MSDAYRCLRGGNHRCGIPVTYAMHFWNLWNLSFCSIHSLMIMTFCLSGSHHDRLQREDSWTCSSRGSMQWQTGWARMHIGSASPGTLWEPRAPETIRGWHTIRPMPTQSSHESLGRVSSSNSHSYSIAKDSGGWIVLIKFNKKAEPFDWSHNLNPLSYQRHCKALRASSRNLFV